jgi:RNA polymerase sigma-70 factor (ECF subfamily)
MMDACRPSPAVAAAGPAGTPPSMSPDDPSRWVDEHGDILFRYALARLSDPTAAEEVVQETLVAALQSQRTFRQESTERTWLVGILKHKVIDHLRRVCRDLPLSANEEGDAVVDGMFLTDGHFRNPPATWNDDPAHVCEKREFWGVFDKCCNALPKRQAALFTLRTMEDTDPGELCKTFGISESHLWVLLHRARTRLRACLERNWFQAQTI